MLECSVVDEITWVREDASKQEKEDDKLDYWEGETDNFAAGAAAHGDWRNGSDVGNIVGRWVRGTYQTESHLKELRFMDARNRLQDTD